MIPIDQQIIEAKAKLFDYIAAQQALTAQINSIEQIKQQTLQQLAELINQKSNPVPKPPLVSLINSNGTSMALEDSEIKELKPKS